MPARGWPAALAANVVEGGRQEMIDRETINRGWTRNPEKVRSLVLSLVKIVSAAAGR